MTNSRDFYCNGCFASQHESPLIALPGNIFLCSDCVDLAHEALHEKINGEVDGERLAMIRADELLALRDKARKYDHAKAWIESVRSAMARADDAMLDAAIDAELAKVGAA